MKNVIFIAIFGLCLLSIGNCEHFSGDLLMLDDDPFTFNGLTVGGKWLILGSSKVDVNGDATIQGDLVYGGDGDIHITGILTVRGHLRRLGSGKFTVDGGIVNGPAPTASPTITPTPTPHNPK